MDSIAIIGGGESGIGAAILAKHKGLEVFVSDFGEIPKNYKEELLQHKIPFEEKGHSFDKIENVDVIVKSPGIPETSEVMRYFRLRQKIIISEIEFAGRYYDGKIIGITGSNGKTTTTKLCHHILSNSDFKVGIGGNIGVSFARLISDESGYDLVVLELSSFQLEDINSFKVDLSVILNITPDHLDRYDYNIKKYAEAKWNLALATKGTGSIILNLDTEICKDLLKSNPPEAKVIWLENDLKSLPVSKETGYAFEMILKGRHNIFNATASIIIARMFGMSDNKIGDALKSFKAVEHRLEPVAKIGNVEFINDSKSTNVDSCFVALASMEKPLVWIAGGTDKGNDYSVIKDLVNEKVSAIICLTKDDAKLKSFFRDFGDKIISTTDVEAAVSKSLDFIEDGVVLLSPACASFDLFIDYEDRGRKFKEAVFKILNERN